MNFRDNLIYLRAANNMTQEQLAMLLGVSRQSVTKWESGKSYPEMDKLLNMCQIFNCSLDDLVQGDMSAEASGSALAAQISAAPSDIFGYDEHAKEFANKISNGVMAIIIGVAASVLLFAMSDPATPHIFDTGENLFYQNLLCALGILCVFIGAGVGLALLIPAGMSHSHFVREHPYIQDFYTPDQKDQARSSFVYQLIGGILLISLGICVVIFFADTELEEYIGIPVLMLLIAVGVRFIIKGGMTLSRVDIDAYNMAAGEYMSAHEIAASDMPASQKEIVRKAHSEDKRIGAICGTIMICATIVALLLLFLPIANGSDDYTQGAIAFFWLPWPIGGLLCGIVAMLIHGFAKDSK